MKCGKTSLPSIAAQLVVIRGVLFESFLSVLSVNVRCCLVVTIAVYLLSVLCIYYKF